MSDDPQRIKKANDVLSVADSLDMDYPAVCLMRGWAEYLSAKQLTSTWFDHALSKGLVLGAVGLALLYIHRPLKNDAKKNPVPYLAGALHESVCPPGVWTALATALYRDGALDNARRVARRAVRANRTCSPAARREPLYILAVIEMAARSNPDDVALCVAEAYKLGAHTDARVLCLIANLHFAGGDFERAHAFATSALQYVDKLPVSVGTAFSSVREQVRAEALSHLARALMHMRRPEEALDALETIRTIYEKHTDIPVNPGVLLRLGLLRLASERKDDEHVAQQCLERVLKMTNDRCAVALRALGVLLGRRILMSPKRGRHRNSESHTRALELLKKGIASGEDGRNDSTAQLVYAGLVEEYDPKRAMIAYRQAVRSMQERGEHIDVEVWNNYSALLARLGEVDEAENMFDNIPEDLIKDSTTLLYNRARLAEMAGNVDLAKSMYRDFDQNATQYQEARVRLAILLMNESGGVKEAEEILKEAIEHNKTRAPAAVYLSNLYSKERKFQEAQTVLEQNRQQGDYLELALAGFMHRFLSSLELDRRDRFLTKHIGQPLMNMLKRNGHNAVAANGVGVCFAEWKQYADARDAFNAANCGANAETVSRINLAHTLVILGQKELADSATFTGKPSKRAVNNASVSFKKAANLYGDALEKMEMKGSREEMGQYFELMLYVAWAHAESENYTESVKYLKKLAHLLPRNHVVWFNLALMLFENAEKMAGEGASIEEMERASLEFEASRAAIVRASHTAVFKSVDGVANIRLKRDYISATDRYIWSRTRKHDLNVVNKKMQKEEDDEKRRQREQRFREFQEREERKKQMAEELKRKKEEELQKAFLQSQQRIRENNEKDLEYQRQQEEKKRKMEFDDEEVVYEDDADVKPTKKRRRKKMRVEEDEDDDDGGSKAKRKRAVKRAPDDSGSEYSSAEEGDGAGGAESPSKRPRFSLGRAGEPENGSPS